MSSLRSGAWRWDVVDAASPAPPGVMGVDGEFLVVSVVDADGQDLSGVLGALGAGDVLNVGVGGGGAGGATSLDGLADVSAPADTSAGKVLGTTGVGEWAPVDPPQGGGVPDWWRTQVEQFLTVPAQWDQPYPEWDAATDYPRSAVVIRAQVPYLANGDPTVGVGPPAAPWVPMSVLRETVGRTLDGLHDVTAPPNTPAGKVLGTTGTGQWGAVDPPAVEPTPQALDDLTDVDVSLAATGMLLTKQLDGSWKGANFTRPLNWLTDVAAPADAEGVLGTTAPGVWEPLPMDHLQQQIVGPLPAQVAALDQRIAALEVTPEPAPVDHALTVDNYSGGFTRIIGAQVIGTDPVRITVSLATTPGVNGTVFADLSAISGSANVWADFAGALGRVEDALTGTPIHGAALKEVIRRGTVVICHRDNTDPAHPTLKVDGTEAAGQAGTSLTLASLADVDNAAATAPAGKVLGTTGVGEWGPVDPPSSPPPALALADLTDVTIPGATVGLVLGSLVQGQWQPVEQVPVDIVGASLVWSSSVAYPAGSVVIEPTSGARLVAVTDQASGAPLMPPGWFPLDGVGTARAAYSSAAALAGGVWKSWTGTQAQFDALPTKDPATLYVITP